MALSSLDELDIYEPGEWPVSIRVSAIILIAIASLLASYWFLVESKRSELSMLVQKEQTLKQEFETKQVRAYNLDAYRQQMTEMRNLFETVVRQLPAKTDVANLLVEISRTGVDNGLQFELIEPAEESTLEFYASMAIRIKIIGDFHQLGHFISAIATMPRIVTIHDVSLSTEQSGGQEIMMEMTAKTYRYIETES